MLKKVSIRLNDFMQILQPAIIALLSFFLFSPAADYQIESRWTLGIKGGYNLTGTFGSEYHYFEGKYGNSPEIENGPDCGVFLEYSFLKFLGVGIDIYFTTKGYDEVFYDDFVQKDYMKAERNYFELPVYVKLQAPFSGRYKPYFFIGTGPAINVWAQNIFRVTVRSYGFNATGTLVNTEQDITEPLTIDLHSSRTLTDSMGKTIEYQYDDFHRWVDIPIVFGIGHAILFSTFALHVITRASIGTLSFNRISDSMKSQLVEKGFGYRNLDEKFFNVSLLLGLEFNTGFRKHQEEILEPK